MCGCVPLRLLYGRYLAVPVHLALVASRSVAGRPEGADEYLFLGEQVFLLKKSEVTLHVLSSNSSMFTCVGGPQKLTFHCRVTSKQAIHTVD